jgi:hypothetical protein
VKRVLILAALAIATTGALTWWWLTRSPASGGGKLHLQWGGSHTGEADLPGEVAWCPVNRMATLLAVSNDTGLIVTLHEADSIVAVPHPVVAPSVRDQAPRPSAVVVLRWAGDSGVLHGYRSVSGLVELGSVGERVSGSLDVRMRAPVGPDTLVVRAVFDDLPVVASAVGCR